MDFTGNYIIDIVDNFYDKYLKPCEKKSEVFKFYYD